MALEEVTSALERLIEHEESSNLFDEKKRSGYFCVEDTLLSRDIHISVNDLGAVGIPLTEDTIKSLTDISSRGKNKNSTLQHIQTIPSKALKVGIKDQALVEVVKRISVGLNLEQTNRLAPQLDSMLVCHPGQALTNCVAFGNSKDVVATLVISLPCEFEGGDLLIEHENNKHFFFGSKNPEMVKFVMFYSNCQFEMQKVTNGCLVFLVYKVILLAPSITSQVLVDENLYQAINKFFSGPDIFEKLVFFLSDNYERKDLKWNLLKRKDRSIAFLLFAIAKRQNRVPCLAIVDIKQTLQPINRYDFEEENETEFEFWVDEHSLEFEEDARFSENEVSNSEPISDICDPYDSDEDEYRGIKYKSYKRTCVVVWSSEWSQPSKFRPAFDRLHKLTNVPGNENVILKKIEQSGNHFYRTRLWKGSIVEKLLDIVIYLKNKAIAISVLSKLSHELLKSKRLTYVKQLDKLFDKNTWTIIIGKWAKMLRLVHEVAFPFINNYSNILDEKSHSVIIELLLDKVAENFIEIYHSPFIHTIHSYNDSTRNEKLFELLKLSCCHELSTVRKKICDSVLSSQAIYPAETLLQLLKKLQSMVSQNEFSHYSILKDLAVTKIDKEILDSFVEVESGWGLQSTVSCTCEDCNRVKAFLHSKSATKFVFQANKNRRSHVECKIYDGISNGLVSRTTDMSCIPHKLKIEKNLSLLQGRQHKFNKLNSVKDELIKINFMRNIEIEVTIDSHESQQALSTTNSLSEKSNQKRVGLMNLGINVNVFYSRSENGEISPKQKKL